MTLSVDLIIVDLSNEGVITLELINVDNNNQLTLDLNLQTQWMVTGDNAGGGDGAGNRRAVDDSGCGGSEGVSVVRKNCAVAAV